MFHVNEIDAVSSVSTLAKKSNFAYAICSQANGLIVTFLTQPNGSELERIKP